MKFTRAHGFFEYRRIKRLYKKAFPLCERKPFSIIKAMQKRGKTDIWYFEDGGAFLGFAATINGDDVVLIDYFAVETKKRGLGFGTKMLKSLVDFYKPRGIFLEIEVPYESSKNYEERIRRKSFYLRAGFKPMNTYAKLFGVDMELLSIGCMLDFDEYRNFYLKNYGKSAFDNIKKI
ncbi:MAG: GNAT family N-acetyltransferase [Clostridia bacterium]|nr:GNAT family N-acetyltransferase [Clostridia bacterium]